MRAYTDCEGPTLCTIPSSRRWDKGPNAIRISRRHTSPRLSLVAKMFVIVGWYWRPVNSELCWRIRCVRVYRESARMSWRMMQPSSLQVWDSVSKWVRATVEKAFLRGAEKQGILFRVARYRTKAILSYVSVTSTRGALRCTHVVLVVTPVWRSGLKAKLYARYRVLDIGYIILVYDISCIPAISAVSDPW